MRNIRQEDSVLVIAHIIGWLIFMAIPVINEPNLLHAISNCPWIFILNYSLLIVYFYLNLNVLVPRILSKKKLLAYIGITFLIYLLVTIVIPWLVHHFFMPGPPHAGHNHPFHGDHHPEFQENDDHRPPMMDPHLMMEKLGFFTRSTYFLIVFIVSTGIRVIAQWYDEKQRLKELESSKTEAELSFLKSQIHPHFLFNSLNSIYYLALSKDDKAPKAILSLSEFLRFVTTESDKSLIPLENEIKMLEEYLELQRLRTPEKIDLQFELSGDFSHHKIMPLTFIPFVENAFKYGISAHHDCFIHLKIKIENGVLELKIENSIIRGQKDLVQSSGVGLSNVQKRLELAYSGRYDLRIKDEGTTFSVYLKILL